MMLCTKCSGGKFSESVENKLVCIECGFEVLIEDGMVVFHPEDSGTHDGMSPCIYDGLMEIEDSHCWMKARKNLIKLVLEKYISRTDKIIDIGGGTGGMARYLIRNGYENISVGEVHLRGLEYAKRCGVKNRYQFDVTKAPFSEHFNVVVMFDVLEHIDDDDLAIKNIYKILKKGGVVIVTVPAHMWLWSKQDALVYHRRRYEVDRLKELFIKNGFKILKVNSFFISILPLLFLRTFISKDDGIIKDDDFKNMFYVNPVVNFISEKILNIEIKLLSDTSMRYGTNIILVGKK